MTCARVKGKMAVYDSALVDMLPSFMQNYSSCKADAFLRLKFMMAIPGRAETEKCYYYVSALFNKFLKFERCDTLVNKYFCEIISKEG